MPPKAKSKTTATTTKSTPAPTKPQAPDWPSLKTKIPPETLHIETLLADQILIIRNLLPSKLCCTLTTFLSTLPLTTTPGIPKRGEAVRVNDRFQIHDPLFAEQLWSSTALSHLVSTYSDPSIWRGDVLGLNPNIRVYRYRPGQFFDAHYDESNYVEFGAEKKTAIPGRTTWTLLVYLTVCEGGETAFYHEAKRKGERVPEPVIVGMEVGMALLHNHVECMLHEGREVVSGEKWVLRSDLVVRR